MRMSEHVARIENRENDTNYSLKILRKEATWEMWV
jgi:hypothetical protein